MIIAALFLGIVSAIVSAVGIHLIYNEGKVLLRTGLHPWLLRLASWPITIVGALMLLLAMLAFCELFRPGLPTN